MYIFCATSSDVSHDIATAIDSLEACEGLQLQKMLQRVSQRLQKACGEKDAMDVDDSDLDEEIEAYERAAEDSEMESDGDAWDSDSPRQGQANTVKSNKHSILDPGLQARVQRDLKSLKFAGFRLSYIANPLEGGENTILMISVRIARLGISDEALQAWHLDSSKYFMLLIRYTSGYLSLEQILQRCAFSGANEIVSLRVGIANDYRLNVADAVAVYNDSKGKRKKNGDPASVKNDAAEDDQQPRPLSPLFIGKPLEDLLGKRLTAILRYRMNYGFKWKGAEDFYNNHQGMNVSEADAINQQYYDDDHSSLTQSLPPIVTADHMQEASQDFSFPLLAMQFSLRHLVRCTEFCLVCHCHIEASFEALKPYVCGKPLCLFQYMAYGFGPSIEHEILTQPAVVDLLVSFCYASAYSSRLKDLPYGMGLMVPFPGNVDNSHVTQYTPRYRTGPINIDGTGQKTENKASTSSNSEPATYKARYDIQKGQLLAPPEGSPRLNAQHLRQGTWLHISGGEHLKFHCRVETSGYETIQLGPLVHYPQSQPVTDDSSSIQTPYPFNPQGSALQPPASVATPPYIQHSDLSEMPLVDIVVYEQHFDELPEDMQFRAIKILLDTLPSVYEMQAYLNKEGGDIALSDWSERISPSALGLLRWIIASNRSCIVQVDDIVGGGERAEERVSGMPGYMQFRFAQGAPDKEQRFISAVKAETIQSNKDYPTLFAWHGSPLHNWHGIVREGLHFRDTINGRAFGNGVYHATDVSTSMGYSGRHYANAYGGHSESGWPCSSLKITEALALNEIVNRPDKFVSKQPHLVVAQLDWIQSRYLFVRCTGVEIPDEDPKNVVGQDPQYTPKGSSSHSVKIPITALSKSRRPGTKALLKGLSFGFKKSKISQKYPTTNGENLVYISDDTDSGDLTVFKPIPMSGQSAPAAGLPEQKGKKPATGDLSKGKGYPPPAMTDFRPGTLNVATLPLIAPPTYATSSATRSLQKELQSTLKIQDSHPLHELGWYVEPNIIENMYQWIVELHSFDSSLPLAKDLKDRGLTSVIAEIRFGRDYPMSPPFFRIIRPRFLSFMQGGGGHVTAGGALCMELLTNSGWSAVNNIESVLLQVRMALCSTDPKPARLEGRKSDPVDDYRVGEAVEAYVRACRTHGWQVPPEFEQSFRPTT